MFLLFALLLSILGGTGKRPFPVAFVAAFGPLFLASVASYLYTWGRFNTLNNINVLVWSLGGVLVYGISERKDNLRKALVVGAGLLALAAIMQYVVVFPRMLETFRDGLYGQIVREQGGLPFASYLHQNMVGGYMAILFPVALHVGIRERWFPGLAASSLILGALVLSSSRIAMALALLVLAAVAVTYGRKRERRHLLVVGAIVLAGAVLSAYLLYGGAMAGQEGGGATRMLEQKARGTLSQLSTVNTRTDIWRNGYRAFQARPILGYGAGNFEQGYKKYFDGATYTRVAHSSVLKVSVELGLLGLACFLWYLGCAAVGFIKKTGRGVSEEFLFASLCALAFGLVDFSFDVPAHVATFFLLTSAPLLSHPGPGQDSGGSFSLRGGIIQVGPSLLVVILLIASFFFTTRSDLARKSIEGGAILEENGLATSAFVAYDGAIQDMPLNNEGYVRVLLILIRSEGNERDEVNRLKTREGIRLYLGKIGEPRDRDSELFFAMARSYALLGEDDRAERYFRQALALYPSSVFYTLEAMDYYRTRGVGERALELMASFRPYMEKYRTPHDPRGVLIYRIRDLEALLEFERGNGRRALAVAEENLRDAREGAFAITSARAREYVSEEDLLRRLQDRVVYFRTRIPATR